MINKYFENFKIDDWLTKDGKIDKRKLRGIKVLLR